MGKNRCPRIGSDGYTLIELMVAVAIVGVLSAIAIPVFSGYLQKSRAQEAIQFLGTIKLRQESYRSEFGEYCNVNTANPGTFASPVSGSDTVLWGAPANWPQLGASPDGPVRFSFNTQAGIPGAALPTSDSWIEAAGEGWGTWGIVTTDFWYVAEAVGDLDDDGTQVMFGTAAGMKGIWCSQAKGWD